MTTAQQSTHSQTRRSAPEGPDEDQDKRRHEFHTYCWGLGIALALTVTPFALVHWNVLPHRWLLGMIGTFAFVQIVMHFRFFLHIDFSKQKREDLQLILFSTLLLLIMGGGTIWIMTNLAARMGAHGGS